MNKDQHCPFFHFLLHSGACTDCHIWIKYLHNNSNVSGFQWYACHWPEDSSCYFISSHCLGWFSPVVSSHGMIQTHLWLFNFTFILATLHNPNIMMEEKEILQYSSGPNLDRHLYQKDSSRTWIQKLYFENCEKPCALSEVNIRLLPPSSRVIMWKTTQIHLRSRRTL